MKNYKLKEIREQKGYTQAEIAKILKTTPQQYYRYENESRDISAHKIKALVEFYKISADELLGIDKIEVKEINIKKEK